MIAETARVRVRKLTLDDAPFILAILNDAAFIEFVGDKNVRTFDAARQYIATVPIASYERHGFGHYLVELTATGEPIGLCSLIKRDWLDDVDFGFAFLPAYRRRGYASEAAAVVLAYARREFGLDRVVAIASPENSASLQLLRKLGFEFERAITPPGEGRALVLLASIKSRGALATTIR